MTDSNEINVAKYIIRQTPIGHLEESIENLKIVCGEELMDKEEVKKEVVSYEEDHLAQVPYSNSKVIVSKLNKDQNDFYYDQSQQIKFKLSDDSKTPENVEAVSDSSTLRKAIEEQLKKYKEKYYKGGDVTRTNVFFDESSGKISVLISAHNINKKNFWSGEWLSTWEMTSGSGVYNVKGLIRANTYYYEEGNIQFSLKTEFDENINQGSDQEVATELIQLIESKENSVQTDLEGVYDNFSDQYIKPLRRKLPVTGTKMNWNLNQIQYGKK